VKKKTLKKIGENMITKEQLEKRRGFICGSDMSALFVDENGKSLNTFATAVDIYAQKVFELEPQKETRAQHRGNKYEAGLIEFANEELGKNIITQKDKLEFINTDILDKNGKPFIMSHLDGYTDEKYPEIIECKTTGLVQYYGESGSDDVPMSVIIQVHVGFLCTGWKKAYVAALLGKFGIQEKLYTIERNETIINAIVERATQFRNENIIPRIPPPESEVGNIEIFKRIVRQPDKFADFDSGFIYE